jgi:hypothetical protein
MFFLSRLIGKHLYLESFSLRFLFTILRNTLETPLDSARNPWKSGRQICGEPPLQPPFCCCAWRLSGAVCPRNRTAVRHAARSRMAESPAGKNNEFCCAGLDDDDYGNQVGRGSSGTSIMTYSEALMKAQRVGRFAWCMLAFTLAQQRSQRSLMTAVNDARLQGEADHQVLEVFRSAYEEVKRGYDDQLINERKTNLAALLLDIANKEGDPGLACFSLSLRSGLLAHKSRCLWSDACRPHAPPALVPGPLP